MHLLATSNWDQIDAQASLLAVGTALALLSAFVGHRLERGRTQRSWLRERRHEAAADLLRVASQMWDEVILLNQALGVVEALPTSASQQDRSNADAAVTARFEAAGAFAAPLSLAVASLEVLGPDELVTAADQLEVDLKTMLEAASRRDLDDAVQEAVHDSVDDFTKVARATIGA